MPFCKHCGENFFDDAQLHVHAKKHKYISLFQCDRCEKTFSQKSHLTKHICIHTGERPYVCEVCARAFRQSSNLKRLLLLHERGKTYTCSVCNQYTSSSKRALVRHELNTHTLAAQHSITPAQRSMPYINLATSSNHNDIICPAYHNIFRDISGLTKHLQKYSGKNHHACPKYRRIFSHINDLTRHQLTHMQEKRYTCPICKVGSNSYSSMMMHIRIHTNDRPFTCQICSKAFTTNGNLQRHNQNVHSLKSRPSAAAGSTHQYNDNSFDHLQTAVPSPLQLFSTEELEQFSEIHDAYDYLNKL
ncbi:C2H2-type zinc finger protein [Enterobacter sp. P82]|uniref:C2H2-type zinc finger protein n=1 Tax=Enterobacter sp. P82 TaxID=3123033 RepID=UPI00300D910A